MAKSLMITLPTLNKWIDKYITSQKEEPKTELPVIDKSNDDKIQIFSNDEFGSIRTLEINGEPWFVGKDIAKILQYTNPQKAIRDHVDEDDKQTFKPNDSFTLKISNYGAIIINESGLYSLILSSKLPAAKKFKRWVTSEVLPSIRKQGAYMTKATIEKVLYNPDFLIKLASNLKAEKEKNIKLQNENENLVKVNDILIGEANGWDNRSLITHLIRKYGCYRYNNMNNSTLSVVALSGIFLFV